MAIPVGRQRPCHEKAGRGGAELAAHGQQLVDVAELRTQAGLVVAVQGDERDYAAGQDSLFKPRRQFRHDGGIGQCLVPAGADET